MNRSAKLKIMVTYPNPDDYTDINTTTRKIMGVKSIPELKTSITREKFRPPNLSSEETEEFLKSIKKIAKKLEFKIQGFHRESSSDLAFIEQHIPKIDGLGPVGSKYLSPEEYIIRDSLIDRAILLVSIIQKYSAE